MTETHTSPWYRKPPPPPRQAPFVAYTVDFTHDRYHAVLARKQRRDAAGPPGEAWAYMADKQAGACVVMYARRPQPAGVEDTPVACAGICGFENGTAKAWMVIAEGLSDEAMDDVLASLRGHFAQLQYLMRDEFQRMEMPIPQKALVTQRWARKIGFKLVLPFIEDYDPKHGAYALYAWEFPKHPAPTN